MMQANDAIGISFFALIMLLLPILLLVMLLRRRVWVIGLVAMAMAFVLAGIFYARVEVRQHAVVPQPVAITSFDEYTIPSASQMMDESQWEPLIHQNANSRDTESTTVEIPLTAASSDEVFELVANDAAAEAGESPVVPEPQEQLESETNTVAEAETPVGDVAETPADSVDEAAPPVVVADAAAESAEEEVAAEPVAVEQPAEEVATSESAIVEPAVESALAETLVAGDGIAATVVAADVVGPAAEAEAADDGTAQVAEAAAPAASPEITSEITADAALAEVESNEALLPGVLATEPAPQSLAVELAEGDTTTSESTQTTSRPKWVIERPSQHEGKMAVVLQSDPFVDRFDCDRDLQQRTAQILTKYAEDYCRSAGLPIPTRLRFDRSELTAAVRDRFYTTRDTSVGPMVEAYQLTVFDDDLRTKLTQHVADAQIDQRLTATGMGAAWVLALVAACHGLCRFAARNAPDPFSKFNAKVT